MFLIRNLDLCDLRRQMGNGLSHLTLFGLEDRVDEIFIRKIMDGIIHGMFYMILKA